MAGEARPMTVPGGLTAQEAALDARIAAEQRARIAKDAWDRWQASLPEKFRGAETPNEKVHERLRRWEAGAPGTSGLVVMGDVGIGKTWVAVGYANLAIKRGLVKPAEILFGTEAELLAAASNGVYSEVEASYRRLIDKRYRMIIIDDVGRGAWLRDENRTKVFSMVLDAAWRDNRVVVVTTNLRKELFAEYIGEAAADRLRSMCAYDVVFLDKNDMRRKTTQAALETVRGARP